MCYEMDICFLKLCLKLNLYFLKRKDNDDMVNFQTHTSLNDNPSDINTTTARNSSRFSKAISSANSGVSDVEQSPAITAIKDDGIEIVTLPRLTPANSQVLKLEPANSTCPLNDDISSNPNSEIDLSDNEYK